MELQLHHRWPCPHSEKVRQYIQENDIEHRVEYVEKEEGTVPCLMINDRELYESTDIINWLQVNVVDQDSLHI